jgi:hypothetical protein
VGGIRVGVISKPEELVRVGEGVLTKAENGSGARGFCRRKKEKAARSSSTAAKPRSKS